MFGFKCADFLFSHLSTVYHPFLHVGHKPLGGYCVRCAPLAFGTLCLGGKLHVSVWGLAGVPLPMLPTLSHRLTCRPHTLKQVCGLGGPRPCLVAVCSLTPCPVSIGYCLSGGQWESEAADAMKSQNLENLLREEQVLQPHRQGCMPSVCPGPICSL